MRIANFVTSTAVEGPGDRFALWLQGCTIKCKSCCNPDLITLFAGKKIKPEELALCAAKYDNEGITILGGEPLDQRVSLKAFLQKFKELSEQGIILFTGYTWQKINMDPLKLEVATLCDLVIAGPFKEDEAPDTRKWIGSKNQTVHFITQRYAYMQDNWPPSKNEVEINITDDEIALNGSYIPEISHICFPQGGNR